MSAGLPFFKPEAISIILPILAGIEGVVRMGSNIERLEEPFAKHLSQYS
jgi:hypothetical protein